MSRPKELYWFVEQANPPIEWLYTSADTKITYQLAEFLPIAIGHDEIESKNELSKSNLTVTVSLDEEMARRWLRSSTDAIVSLTIFSGDIDTAVTAVIWKGRLASVKPTDKSIQLIFESIFTSLRRPGLRRKYQATCPHVLYGNNCKAPKANFAFEAIPTVVNGIFLTVPYATEFADGWFTGGMIEGVDGVARFIVSHVGENIKLIRPLEGLEANQAITLYPGCDRLASTCESKFNNLLNIGSFPYIPIQNPFKGRSIV